MKKWLILPFFILMMAISIPGAMATNLSDGTYNIDYELLQSENGSVSIANDYFEKPATITIHQNEQYLQFRVNHAQWIKFIKSASGESFTDMHIVSEDLENDERVVAFKVDGDITKPLPLQMHVKIDEMEPAYDHKYTVRLGLDLETMEATDAHAIVLDGSELEEKSVESTSNKVLIYVLLAIIGFVAIIFIRKLRTSKNKKSND